MFLYLVDANLSLMIGFFVPKLLLASLTQVLSVDPSPLLESSGTAPVLKGTTNICAVWLCGLGLFGTSMPLICQWKSQERKITVASSSLAFPFRAALQSGMFRWAT